MLDRLRARQQAGVEGRRVPVFLHDLLAFLDDTDDGVAGLGASSSRTDGPTG